MSTFRSKVSLSYEGIGLMLKSEMVEREMVRRAIHVREHAEATAPVGSPRRDRAPGRFKAGFVVESRRDGGIKGDRAEAVVVNHAPDALYAELGTSRQRGHHTLRNALFSRGGD
jgi:hypothetical protein